MGGYMHLRKNLNIIMLNKGFVTLILACIVLIATSCERSQEITVESEPEGANVYVDDNLVGQSPINVNISSENQKLRLDFKEDINASTKLIPPTRKKASRAVTAAYLPLTANLPLFVALENGYFEQNGIKVTAIEATSPNDIVTGLVSGKLDFAGVLAYSIIFPASIRYPGKLKLFNSCEETINHFTSSIITKKDSPINTYEDLRGRKIGVYTGLVQINFLKAILIGLGIDPGKVEIIKISPRLQIQGLVSDQYDALSSTEPTVNIAKIQGITKVVVENPRLKYIMCPFPSAATVISSKLFNEDRLAANGIVEAFNMAVDFINSYPEKAKKILLKFTPIPKNISEEVLADLKLFKYVKLGEENRLNVQRFADYLFENGILQERIEDVNKLFGDYEEVCSSN